MSTFLKKKQGDYTGEAAKKLFWFNFHSSSCTINRIPAIFSGSLDIILTKFKSWKIRLVRVKRKKSWFESSIEEELVLSDFLLKLTLEQMSQICTILPRVSSNDPLPFFFYPNLYLYVSSRVVQSWCHSDAAICMRNNKRTKYMREENHSVYHGERYDGLVCVHGFFNHQYFLHPVFYVWLW